MAQLRCFRESDYEAVRQFLMELSRDTKQYINWNWARLEWMYAHPEFDREPMGEIGLWWDGSRVVGAAIYDMYFGEAFCGVLPEYEALYPEVLAYAWEHLRDEAGLAIAVCDENEGLIRLLTEQGYRKDTQDETILEIQMDEVAECPVPEGFRTECFDPAAEPYRFQWLLWRGFDHGMDRAEFEQAERIVPQIRPNLKKELSVAAVNEAGESCAYCCVWYDEACGYAYVEPVCTAPDCRGKGLGRLVVTRALRQAGKLGAKNTFVISDQPFYYALGFRESRHFTFYRRNL